MRRNLVILLQQTEAYPARARGRVRRRGLLDLDRHRRRYRLTNTFSKKVENLLHAVSLHFMYYNFARPHTTLKAKNPQKPTPAMAAGVADHVWSIEEIVGLIEAREAATI